MKASSPPSPTRWQYRRDMGAIDRGAAWLTNTGFMLAFLVPALLGVLWQPGAGSSGVPGVIAFLNGCNIPNALTPKVWAVKVLGLCCSVASGLPAGSEGPMAQIGAMTALMLIEYTARPCRIRWPPSCARPEHNRELY